MDNAANTNEQPINDFDFTSEESELNTLQQEINQLESALENNGADYLTQNLTEQDEELFFSNPKEFFITMMTKLNDFYNNSIGSKKQKAQDLTQSINQKKQFAEYDKAEKEFLQSHPNINLDDLYTFVNEDLSPRIQREINQLEPLEALKKAYEYYIKDNTNTANDKLPKRLEGKAQRVDDNATDDYDEILDRM